MEPSTHEKELEEIDRLFLTGEPEPPEEEAWTAKGWLKAHAKRLMLLVLIAAVLLGAAGGGIAFARAARADTLAEEMVGKTFRYTATKESETNAHYELFVVEDCCFAVGREVRVARTQTYTATGTVQSSEKSTDSYAVTVSFWENRPTLEMNGEECAVTLGEDGAIYSFTWRGHCYVDISVTHVPDTPPSTSRTTTTTRAQSGTTTTRAQTNTKWGGRYLYENCRVLNYSETTNTVCFVPVCDLCGVARDGRNQRISGAAGSQRSGLAYCDDCNHAFGYEIIIQ